jgi:two-component sensor histidine kinase
MKSHVTPEQQLEKLRTREQALAKFGTFAFSEQSLDTILSEAARICVDCLGVPFSKVCEYRKRENDLRVVAGYGWKPGVVGYAISVANESSPQGRAFATGEPQVCGNVKEANSYSLPSFYPDHGVVSTVDVLVASKSGVSFGVLEVDSPSEDAFDEDDIDFLTAFANILAEAVATAEREEALRKTIGRMKELVAEKEVLSQELKHRVRNNLHLVFGLLMTEVGANHEPTSTFAFRSIALRVMGLAGVFDHLLGTGLSKTISFGDYVVTLCDNLPDLYANEHVNLRCPPIPSNWTWRWQHLLASSSRNSSVTRIYTRSPKRVALKGLGRSASCCVPRRKVPHCRLATMASVLSRRWRARGKGLVLCGVLSPR